MSEKTRKGMGFSVRHEGRKKKRSAEGFDERDIPHLRKRKEIGTSHPPCRDLPTEIIRGCIVVVVVKAETVPVVQNANPTAAARTAVVVVVWRTVVTFILVLLLAGYRILFRSMVPETEILWSFRSRIDTVLFVLFPINRSGTT